MAVARGVDWRADLLHYIVNGQCGMNSAPATVDHHFNRFAGIFQLEVEQLPDYHG